MLTHEQKIQVIDLSILDLEKQYTCMCPLLRHYVRVVTRSNSLFQSETLATIFPEFIASRPVNANRILWYPSLDRKSRIKHLQKLRAELIVKNNLITNN